MYLDKDTTELALKIVFAGAGNAALDEVSAIAARAVAGRASPVVPATA